MSLLVTHTRIEPLQGFLNINKPRGRSSRQVVDTVKKRLCQLGCPWKSLPKIGHAGTLDPLATGVLVVCVGAATRLINIIHSGPKKYRATFLLGRRSETDDVAGNVVEVAVERASQVTRAELDALLPLFTGCIEQVPPAFSAVHVAGKRAYELARCGQSVELKSKSVEIYRLDIVRFEPPELEFDIECSSGTYVRSLGRDIGNQLGCGAVMCELIRTRVGLFDIAQAIPRDELSAEILTQHLQPCAIAVRHFASYVCRPDEIRIATLGRTFVPRTEAWTTLPHSAPQTDEAIAMLDSHGKLVAVGRWTEDRLRIGPRINLIGIG